MKKYILAFSALLAFTLVVFSQILPVNIGTNPNDGTGDTLRVAFGKVNTNFSIVATTNWVATNTAQLNAKLWGTNLTGAVVVDSTNIISSSGSFLNGIGVTNGELTLKQKFRTASAPFQFMNTSTVEYARIYQDSFNVRTAIGLGNGAVSTLAVSILASANGVVFGAGSSSTVLTNIVAKGALFQAATNEPAAVPGYAQIYAATNAGVTELYVQGDDGTETQISSHPADAPTSLYDTNKFELEQHILREVNPFVTNGVVRWVNTTRMARITELNTRAILYLAGNDNSGMSNALQRLKDFSPAERQILVVESFSEYNARTGRNLKPLDWDTVQNQRQATYDAERAFTIQQAEWLTQTNAIIAASGSTNFVEIPTVPPAINVRQAKPQWLTK